MVKSYSELSELEKIPLRIAMAEKLFLDDLSKGIDLKDQLKWCIENEQYCGAEGIKRALQKFGMGLD